MPKFLDVPQWYNEDGELVEAALYLHLLSFSLNNTNNAALTFVISRTATAFTPTTLKEFLLSGGAARSYYPLVGRGSKYSSGSSTYYLYLGLQASSSELSVNVVTQNNDGMLNSSTYTSLTSLSGSITDTVIKIM